jgi:tetratricopeptide (TPR) repeat protein
MLCLISIAIIATLTLPGEVLGASWSDLYDSAEVKWKAGDLSAADRLLASALTLSREIPDDREPEMRILQRRAMVLRRQGRDEEAGQMTFARLSLSISEDPDPANLYNDMSQLASTYEKLNRFEEALALRRAVYALFKRHMNHVFQAGGLYDLSDHFRKRKDYAKAEEYLLGALTLLRSEDTSKSELVYALRKYSDFLLEVGRKDDASAVRSEADAIEVLPVPDAP